MRPGFVRLVLVLTALASVLMAPALAGAAEPFRMATQIEDKAGVLGDRTAEVQAALTDLQDSEQVQLWVTYVDTFSGLGAQEWADQTATVSDFGLRDVLLAVAVDDRAYAYSVDQDFPLTQAQLDEVMAVAVEPALTENDWAGAAIGAATGLGEALRGEAVTEPTVQPGASSGSSSGGSSLTLVLVVVVLIVVVALVVWLLVRASRRARGKAAGADAASPEDLPLDELRRRANAALIATDDAVKTSTEELGFAVAGFGEEQAAPFKKALDQAQLELSQAFELRKQFDEAKDEATKRRLLTGILERTQTANAALDAEAERFDKLRDLERNAPEVLAGLERQLGELEARRPEVEKLLAQLAAQYAPSALAPVSGAPAEAGSRVDFAREHVKAGREDLDAGRGGEAAIEATAAESAVGQAQQLLDSVERLRQDLASAQASIDEAVAETQRDIAEARAGAGAQLASLVATAEAAMAGAAEAAGPEGGRDPLAALRRIKDADDALEQALQQVRDEQARRAKAAESLERTLVAARSEVASASDYITTHRGAVRSGPRARLAEAQRDLDKAVALGATDPEAAAQLAAQAQDLAGRAFAEAREQTETALGGSQMSGMGGLGPAVLGGILAGAMMGGGMPGGGGFGGGGPGGGMPGGGRRGGGGGFAPPGFGGGGTRMRRGGGGRF